jgi:hypothetical protein
VYGALYGVWGPLGCMGPFRVYGALYGVWSPLGCMGLFRAYGALKDPTCALRVVGFGIVDRTSPFRMLLFQFFLRIDVMHTTDTNTVKMVLLLNL